MLLKLILTALLLPICLLAGCSSESLQRNSYEMFRNMEREECLKNSDQNPEECYSSEDYDTYQRQRQDRLDAEP